jgi:DnaJ family protein C protein 3
MGRLRGTRHQGAGDRSELGGAERAESAMCDRTRRRRGGVRRSQVGLSECAVTHAISRLATLNPSALDLPLRLSHIAYFLLGSPTAMNHIKQCLHYDPDSKSCKRVHKLLRSLEKDTAKARNFVEGSSWRQAIKVLDGVLARFEKALDEASQSQDGVMYLPKQFHPKTKSQTRLDLYTMACKAAVGANELRKDKGMRWCDEVLAMDEGNADALAAQGERLMKEEKWEEALRVLERAFENSGRRQDVSGVRRGGKEDAEPAQIMQRLQKAQRLLKVSKQKDYYKVGWCCTTRSLMTGPGCSS